MLGPETFSFSMLIIFLQGGLEALVVVLFIVNRARFKQFYKTGLAIGIIAFGLNLPFQVLTALSLDIGKMLESFSTPGPEITPDFISAMQAVMVGVTVFSLIVAVGLAMLSYTVAAAEWEKLRLRPFPLLMRTGEKAWGRIGIAALVGVAGAFVSLAFIRLLNVKENDVFQEIFSGSVSLPIVWKFVISLLFVSAAALTEEILYRGALLWAVMHLLNTNTPTFKVAQVFVLGVILAELARRWSLEAAIACHLSLNVVSLALEYVHIF
jgi:membrane protease YdiL (CAAX protease family)